ncbi:hypothetical protein [Halomonas huangheensis]|uniref:Uncharacterized protein n=1 Tax=Halomonas huangheensis TaxID=1178482 RepID=W1NBZ5_9GAMM|nr:hypothetical protein [Halomonas huangheensis]ALM52741.1 hypothetical protein AR456_10970 [Halomonas huangheensis]ERL52721.1 hypothetical protein BJB45_15695 [Halomonas huangheensis]
MASQEMINEYRRWRAFQRQAQLDTEHRAARRKIDESRVSATRMTEAYRAMAEKGAEEGAFYRTIYLRSHEDAALTCEGWLFVRRVLAEGGSTRVRATLLETFQLANGQLEPGKTPAEKVTLEIYDQLLVEKGMATAVRVDRIDGDRQVQFLTFSDQVRGDMRRHLD